MNFTEDIRTVADGRIGYRLLKRVNLLKRQQKIARATVADLTYKNMTQELKAMFDKKRNRYTSTQDDIACKVEVTNVGTLK